jgi:hypothetical protein
MWDVLIEPYELIIYMSTWPKGQVVTPREKLYHDTKVNKNDTV